MVLIKDKVVMAAPRGKKPTRFIFRGNIRIGFKGRKEVVEIVKFKEKK